MTPREKQYHKRKRQNSFIQSIMPALDSYQLAQLKIKQFRMKGVSFSLVQQQSDEAVGILAGFIPSINEGTVVEYDPSASLIM